MRKTKPLGMAEIGVLLLLQLLTEDRMSGGADPDGSATLGRAQSILGGWRQIGRTARADGTPFDRRAEPAIAELRQALDRAEPILARVAKPTIRPPLH